MSTYLREALGEDGAIGEDGRLKRMDARRGARRGQRSLKIVRTEIIEDCKINDL